MSEEQRRKVLTYLQQLYIALKDIIDKIRQKIKTDEDNFDHITTCLSEFKEKSTSMLMELAISNF